MRNLAAYLKRHQLVAYFGLTYGLTWTLLLLFQPLYLEGQRIVAPLIGVGIFAPSLVSIGLSAVLEPLPRQGSCRTSMVALMVVWLVASPIIVLYLTTDQQMELSARLVIVSAISGLLPAYIASAVFSTVPGIGNLLRTFRNPRGSLGYYILALVLIPAMWSLGHLLSRALGAEARLLRDAVVDARLLVMVVLFFIYNVIYGGLSEEPGWRGFALPRLQAKFSPLVSSLILGVIWAVWHAPLRFGGIGASRLSDTLVEWGLIVLVTVIFTWLFNRTKGSVLATALIHPAMNSTGSFLNASSGALILLLAFTVFATVLDKMWRKLPTDSPAIYLASAHAA